MTDEQTGLLHWVAEQIDHDERLAHACQAEVGTLRAGDPYPDGSGVADRDDYPSYPWGSQERELAFMAMFGPAEALRQVAAHRRILGRHRRGTSWHGLVRCDHCSLDGFEGIHVDYPCPDLRDLLSVYEGRDGYDPAWAVTP